MASGMAGKVRRATESDEFDLGGYDQARCDELARGAFTEPFPLAAMVRLSFVVGGGKLVRQKYSDDLPKMFMSALSGIGFQDDNSASVEAGSGGKYKFQHDTGKNLKFVHVFPNIAPPTLAPRGEEEEAEEEAEEEFDGVPKNPEVIFFRCEDEEEFLEMLHEHVQTYAEKKRLMELTKDRIQKLEEIEGKMTRLEALDASEQALFDDVGADDLRAKLKLLTAELQKMVDEGKLTSSEKAAFLEQLDEKLEAVSEQIAKAEAEGKAKRVQALTQQREVMRKTRTSAKDADAVKLPALRHADQLRKLHQKLIQLAQMEKMSKGHYTMDELKRLGERPEIKEAVSVLENRSRGWFETDEVFQERLQACIRSAAPPRKPGGGSGGYAGGGGGARPSGSGGYGGGGGSGGFTAVKGGARTAKAKAAAPSTRNAFSALDR